MTKLLYQTNSYLKEFSAKVVSVMADIHTILLDQTVFYPGGGGQVYDKGIIEFNGERAVLKRAKYSPDGILHIFEEGEPIPEDGCEVTGTIDWDRRYKVMRTHTAMHILCGTIFRDYGALVTGGDMEPLKGRMDFELPVLSVVKPFVRPVLNPPCEIYIRIADRVLTLQIRGTQRGAGSQYSEQKERCTSSHHRNTA